MAKKSLPKVEVATHLYGLGEVATQSTKKQP